MQVQASKLYACMHVSILYNPKVPKLVEACVLTDGSFGLEVVPNSYKNPLRVSNPMFITPEDWQPAASRASDVEVTTKIPRLHKRLMMIVLYMHQNPFSANDSSRRHKRWQKLRGCWKWR